MRTPTDTTRTLGIVIPAYNEDPVIASVIREWSSAIRALDIPHRFIVIDNASTDRTAHQLSLLEIEIPELFTITLTVNKGHGNACRTGYKKAIDLSCAWILQLDGDGQCDPIDFPSLWSEREDADCVFGYRSLRTDSLLRKIISGIFSITTSILTRCRIRDVNVPYRLIRSAPLQTAMASLPDESPLLNGLLTVQLRRIKDIRWKELPIHFRPRDGKSHFSLGSMFLQYLRFCKALLTLQKP